MEAVSKTFHASIDNGVKIITGSLILFALLFIGGILLFSPNEIKFFLCLINTPLLLIVFFAWLYSPVSYTVSGGDVIINRKIGNVYLHIKDWENVRPVSEHELGRVWRMAGNGGLFGYTGWFSTSLGKMRW
ncbi:MAG TPA: hypothetical protein PLP34_08165, partial [Chitinophagaceae bacterium]|nr:hypothetical protein [Chitinophagaceae bacterium]